MLADKLGIALLTEDLRRVDIARRDAVDSEGRGGANEGGCKDEGPAHAGRIAAGRGVDPALLKVRLLLREERGVVERGGRRGVPGREGKEEAEALVDMERRDDGRGTGMLVPREPAPPIDFRIEVREGGRDEVVVLVVLTTLCSDQVAEEGGCSLSLEAPPPKSDTSDRGLTLAYCAANSKRSRSPLVVEVEDEALEELVTIPRALFLPLVLIPKALDRPLVLIPN